MKLYSAITDLKQDPFGLFTTIINNITSTKQLTNDGVLLLHGGEDISPSIYHERPVFTLAPKKPSTRDALEINLINKALDIGMPIIGICRGAQLMCCMSGGSLWQHMDGHLNSHDIHTIDGKLLYARASHHQAMRLPTLDVMRNAIVLAETMEATKGYSQDHKQGIGLRSVLEVIYFKNTNCLAIQPHPEWMSPCTPFNQWCAEQIKTFLFKE